MAGVKLKREQRIEGLSLKLESENSAIDETRIMENY